MAADTDKAQKAKAYLENNARFMRSLGDWKHVGIVLGGDGTMLKELHRQAKTGQFEKMIGFNLGHVGFLMNRVDPDEDKLGDNILLHLEKAEASWLWPLGGTAITKTGEETELLAFNEIAVGRSSAQTAKLEITVDGQTRLELAGDGLICCTPAGSTAYNASAGGPIIPIGAHIIGLCPNNPYSPRRWPGALLDWGSIITIKTLESEKRPVGVTHDYMEVGNVVEVTLFKDEEHGVEVLFDRDHSHEERILQAQFPQES